MLLQKSTAGQEKSNYRLVSNPSFILKIAEKVTLIQFAKHCDENRLLLISISIQEKSQL